MTDYKPDFLIIPGVIAYDKEIPFAGRMLYSIIYWLDSLKMGQCIASNETLASFIDEGTTANYVGRLLKILEDKGHIRREYSDEGKMNRTRIIPLVTYSAAALPPPRNLALPPLESRVQISNNISNIYKYIPVGQLPLQAGKTPLSRLSNAYTRLYRDMFSGLEPKINLRGSDGGVFKSLLKDYTEYQIALILNDFFELRDQKLIDAAFPIAWLPSRLNQIVANVSLDMDFKDPVQVKKTVDKCYAQLSS